MQSATLLPEEQWNKNSVLSCAITAGEDGYFVTSIPMQNGLKLYVDGKLTKLEKVNTVFAGAKVTAGTHTVDLQFEPPGQRYGIMASLLSVILFGIWAIPFCSRRADMSLRKIQTYCQLPILQRTAFRINSLHPWTIWRK